MINEQFLQSAVRIRRTYLKLSNNMDLYHKQATKLSEILTENLEKLSKIEGDVKDKKMDSKQAVNTLLELISNIEKQSTDLESMTDDLNKEIELLSKEEHELYRNIKEKHSDLTDEQIIESVKERLIRENIYYND